MSHYALLLEPIPFLISSILVGAIIGSFLTMLVHRLPRILQREWQQECQHLLDSEINSTADVPPESLASPASYCPHCRQPLRWIDNIPLLGYLFNHGHCHNCDASIHWRYPLLELLAIAIALTTTLHFGPGLQAVVAAFAGWALLALLFIDLEHQLLPDSITLPLLWSGLLINQQQLFTSSTNALWGAVFGYLSLWLVFHLYRTFTGREGLGRGDFKLFAALGAWCGWALLPQILLIASVSGILLAFPLLLRKQEAPLMTTAIPFGPFLALGGWFTLLFGDLLNPFILAGLFA